MKLNTVLVLNASYEPLSVINTNRAVVLVMTGKVEVLEDTGEIWSSAHEAVITPSVVRLLYMVDAPRQLTIPLSRRALFIRDRNTCQYCGDIGTKESPMEVEHVVPRSRGGRNIWENVVAACRVCNGRKAARTPQEAGMVLRSKPFAPTRRNQIASRGNKAWEKYTA